MIYTDNSNPLWGMDSCVDLWRSRPCIRSSSICVLPLVSCNNCMVWRYARYWVYWANVCLFLAPSSRPSPVYGTSDVHNRSVVLCAGCCPLVHSLHLSQWLNWAISGMMGGWLYSGLLLLLLLVELRQACLINNTQMSPCHCDPIITVYCMCALHPPVSLLLPSQTAGCPALHLGATDSQNFCHHGFYHWQLVIFLLLVHLRTTFTAEQTPWHWHWHRR